MVTQTPLKPQFVYFIGATGAGKNYIYSRTHSNLPLVDIDKIAKEISDETGKDIRKCLSPAIQTSKMRMRDYFKHQTSFAHVGTGGNIQATRNKIQEAKDAGFDVILILVDTYVETAKMRNFTRAQKGEQRFVPEWKVEVSYKKARETYENLKGMCNLHTIIQN